MFNKIITVSAIGAAALVSASPAFAASDLVTNGNFETSSTAAANGNFQLTGNNAYGSVAGWTSLGGYNLLFNSSNASTPAGNATGLFSSNGSTTEYLDASKASPTGGNFIALDGDSNAKGALEQQINGLTVGQTYNLSFYWGAGELKSGGTPSQSLTESLSYGFAPTVGAFATSVYQTTPMTYSTGTFNGWSQVTTSFTATSASEALFFISNGTPQGAPPVALLDGVSIIAAVPEPATWAMMILGFGVVGVGMRSAKRRSEEKFSAKIKRITYGAAVR